MEIEESRMVNAESVRKEKPIIRILCIILFIGFSVAKAGIGQRSPVPRLGRGQAPRK